MYGSENPVPNNRWRGYESTPIVTNLEIAPKAVLSHTRHMLDFLRTNLVKPEICQDYLKERTYPFLKKAAEGADNVYGRGILFDSSKLPDINEAGNFSHVVFSWMHHFAISGLYPLGFSRKGVLRAPKDKDEFKLRLWEIRCILPEMFDDTKRESLSFSDSRVLRTVQFLKVGSSIPIKIIQSDSERRQYEDEVVAKLTDGIDFSF